MPTFLNPKIPVWLHAEVDFVEISTLLQRYLPLVISGLSLGKGMSMYLISSAIQSCISDIWDATS